MCDNYVTPLNLESDDITLGELRKKHPNNLTLGYININSVRHKLQDLFEFVNKTINIVANAETKINAKFPSSQFLIEGMKKPYRLDITDKSGGHLVYVDQNISSVQIYPKSLKSSGIQTVVLEIKSQK